MLYYTNKILLVCVVLFHFKALCFNIKQNKLEWHCQAACKASGAKFNLNQETKSCECIFNKIIDDTDIVLVQKNAKIFGVPFSTITPLGLSKIIIKRETAINPDPSPEIEPEVAQPQEIEHTKTAKQTTLNKTTENEVIAAAIPPTVKIDTNSADVNSQNDVEPSTSVPTEEKDNSQESEAIVGQQAPISPFRRLHQQRAVVAPRRVEPRQMPMSTEQQRIILQQIRDHANRLSTLTDQRTRQVEIEAIRANLRHLSQSTISPAVATPRLRLRTLTDETRRRSLRQRLAPHSRIVGAAAPKEEEVETPGTKGENEAETAIKEIKKIHPHFEVITSPILTDD